MSLKKSTINVQGTTITVLPQESEDYISLTDMVKAKDGEFFIADWLRNRNTVEFFGIWESVFNPGFIYGEFAINKSQVGLEGVKPSRFDTSSTPPHNSRKNRDNAADPSARTFSYWPALSGLSNW